MMERFTQTVAMVVMVDLLLVDLLELKRMRMRSEVVETLRLVVLAQLLVMDLTVAMVQLQQITWEEPVVLVDAVEEVQPETVELVASRSLVSLRECAILIITFFLRRFCLAVDLVEQVEVEEVEILSVQVLAQEAEVVEVVEVY